MLIFLNCLTRKSLSLLLQFIVVDIVKMKELLAEAYSEGCQTPKTGHFSKIVIC